MSRDGVGCGVRYGAVLHSALHLYSAVCTVRSSTVHSVRFDPLQCGEPLQCGQYGAVLDSAVYLYSAAEGVLFGPNIFG